MNAIFRRVPPPPTPSHPLLDRLWTRYAADVPYAASFARLHKTAFHNDHIALRTLAHPGPGVAMFARVFERLGWNYGGEYVFPDVYLHAIYLKKPGWPRIFISELDAHHLPADAREALIDAQRNTEIPPDDVDALAEWFKAPKAPVRAAIEAVKPASQYGAWLLAFGRKVNHFTACVDDVERWQKKLVAAGVPMKAEIEGERGGPLRQTATHAALADVRLADGTWRKLPYAYFEVAERRNGFDGFLAPQARQLFDMTGAVEVTDIAAPYAHPRKHPRKEALLQVTANGGPVTTENVSLGGVFLHFERDPPEPHAVVEMAIDLPTAGRIHATGTVVYRVPGRGVGVEFTWWDDDADPARAALKLFLDGL